MTNDLKIELKLPKYKLNDAKYDYVSSTIIYEMTFDYNSLQKMH